MRNKLKILIFITLISFTFSASGQKLVNSPYSRFNIGSLEPAASFRSLGMGGVGTAFRDNTSIYFTNPASYSSIDTNSFVFDFGLDYSMNFVKEGSTRYFSDDINFDHLIMGFPLTKRWGVATGIVPISNGYYKIADVVRAGDDNYDALTGAYSSYHSGSGGFNNFFLGTGLKITKNLSLGINMTILFGQINRLYQVSFLNAANYNNVFNNQATETLRMSGINFDYGLQYTASLKNNYFLNVGASYTSGHNYKSNYEQVAFTYTNYATSTDDTISYISDNTTKAFIPGTIKLGIAFGKKNKFSAGFDYISTKWSEAIIYGSDGYTADTRSYLFGVEFIPDKYSNFSFLQRMEYRFGGHLADNYLIINGEQLKEYGASFGIGIPLRRTFSKANLFFDWTKKYGPPSGTLHTENFYTMGVSLNLYDFWFVKRKYD